MEYGPWIADLPLAVSLDLAERTADAENRLQTALESAEVHHNERVRVSRTLQEEAILHARAEHRSVTQQIWLDRQREVFNARAAGEDS